MKKVLSMFLLMILVIFTLTNGQAIALDKVETSNGGETLSFFKSIELIEEEKSYIPIWRFLEAVEGELASNSKSLTIIKEDRWLKFAHDDQTVETSSGDVHQEKVFFKDENIYIPIKYVAKYFGYDVQFIQEETQPSTNPLKGDLENDMIPKMEQEVVVKVEEKPQPRKVYLTFDDGPNEHIDLILNTLAEKQAKATFFMLEPLMAKYSDSVKRLVAEGHYPALHSVTHDRNKLYYGDPLNVAKEMEKTRQTLLELTGVDSKLTRVPYGSKPFMKDPLRNGLVENGFKMWDWTVDTVDWKYQKSNPRMIVENVKAGIENLKNGNEPIVILMHVNKGTASVLPEIIDYIHGLGLECAPYDPNHHTSVNFWQDDRL
ncbi:polysaccharide deacetylase family protein [Cytobacillus sp. FJAT-54145]|uniref:Polysaccharide deacetylase family protein n=1 Tax=Cytobacillus spartinae TaxID=3299023 RepID=A0ABW6KFN5_9BACI